MIELVNQIIDDFINSPSPIPSHHSLSKEKVYQNKRVKSKESIKNKDNDIKLKASQGNSLILIGNRAEYFLKNKLNNCKYSLWIYADLLPDLDSIHKFTNGQLFPPSSIKEEKYEIHNHNENEIHNGNSKLVLVVNDIDLYTINHHQQVLYTLFEMTLTRPLLLIGISKRIDILELFEKRVKSRFSQIIAYMGSSPDSFEDFHKELFDRVNQWSPQVAQLIDKTLLHAHYQLFNNINLLLSKFYLFICSHQKEFKAIGIKEKSSREKDLTRSICDIVVDKVKVNQIFESKEELIEHLDELSYPSLFILISMKRLKERADGGGYFMDFETIWQEYNYIINILNLVGMQHRYGRITMRMAFEDLISRGILRVDRMDKRESIFECNQEEFGVESNILLSLLAEYLQDNQKLDSSLKSFIKESV